MRRMSVWPLLLAAVVSMAPMLRAQLVPNDFAHDVLVDIGLERPVGLTELPDGRIILVEHHSGRVLVSTAGHLRVIGQIPSIAAGAEDGLLGVAHHPDWVNRPELFFYATILDGGQRRNRLLRYSVSGVINQRNNPDLVLDQGSESVLLELGDAVNDIHNAGTLRFDATGRLLISSGDGGFAMEAQQFSSARGKLLRIDVSALPTGAIPLPDPHSMVPADNPFESALPIWERLTFCYGLRNPFRFHIDSALGAVVIGEVGAATWEEVNIARGGENFGWPFFEADTQNLVGSFPSNLSEPAFVGPHGPIPGMTAIATFGGIYRDEGGPLSLGPAYDGDMFFADLRQNAPLYRFTNTSGVWSPAPPVPGQLFLGLWGFVGFPADSIRGADGALYYVDYLRGRLARVKNRLGAFQMTRLSAQTQIGNAGVAAFDPPRVRLTDANGAPVAGEAVYFGSVLGSSEPLRVSLTDANGIAVGDYALASEREAADPVILASHPLSNSVSFEFEWRGLEVGYDPNLGYIDIIVEHSLPFAPISIACEVQLVSQPLMMTAAGDIWTSIMSPTPALFVLGDGLGLAGPQNPNYFTDTHERFRQTIVGLPSFGGVRLVMQAYGYHQGAGTGQETMLSNPVQLFLL